MQPGGILVDVTSCPQTEKELWLSRQGCCHLVLPDAAIEMMWMGAIGDVATWMAAPWWQLKWNNKSGWGLVIATTEERKKTTVAPA